MSRTTDLFCLRCGEGLWVGQGAYIYTGQPETMQALGVFLVAHRGHELRFDWDDTNETCGLRDLHDEDVLKSPAYAAARQLLEGGRDE